MNRSLLSNYQPDRRKTPRFQLPMALSLAIAGAQDGQTLDAAVINASINGVYCKVNHYLPLFEKVLITFVLPEQTEPAFHLISECEGVVVRIEPEEEEPGRADYAVALYFNNLSETERDLLQTMLATYGNAHDLAHRNYQVPGMA